MVVVWRLFLYRYIDTYIEREREREIGIEREEILWCRGSLYKNVKIHTYIQVERE